MLTSTTSLTPVSSGLARKATIVGLTASIWTARRFDRKVTDEVNDLKRAAKNAGRYNKLLVDGKHLAPLTALLSAARELHYKYASPWGEQGMRLLPNTLYKEFTDQFRAINQQYDEAADAFAKIYPQLVAEAPKRLNGLFKASDYPSASEIRSKFKLGLRWSTVSDPNDFRTEALDADTIEDIRKEIADSVRQQERDAVTGVYRQIGDVVGRMAERLKEYDNYDPTKKDRKTGKVKKVYFKDSLVENVKELAALLPAFNGIMDDPKLAKLTERIETELCTESAQELRDNDDARVAVQKSAEEIFDAVSAFMA